MVHPAQDAAERLAAESVDAAVVNCRFLKPYDREMLERIIAGTKLLVVIEEGAVTNGFGAYLGRELALSHPEVRVVTLGVPDALIEQAPRAEQLDWFGLTGPKIARTVNALLHEGTLESR